MNATIYTSPSCSHCKNAKKYLQDLGITVKEIDISHNERAAEEMTRKTGQKGVPVILLKGSTIIGFNKNKIDAILGIK